MHVTTSVTHIFRIPPKFDFRWFSVMGTDARKFKMIREQSI